MAWLSIAIPLKLKQYKKYSAPDALIPELTRQMDDGDTLLGDTDGDN